MNSRLSRFAPSPAMIVALISLIVAMSGTAVAAGLIGPKDISKNAILSKHIKKGAVGTSDLSKSVRSQLTKAGATGAAGAQGAQGSQGSKGDKGDKGDTGAAGAAGADGTAIAYGYLNADGTFDASRSKGVIATSRQAAGIYCVQLASTPKNVVASAVRDAAPSDSIVATKVPPNATSCAATHELQIVITNELGAFQDGDVMFNAN